jgi:alkylation response protein AidB-like acyl-CoA dehydrogenase
VKERKAFGRRVSDLQTVQHKLAEIKTSIAVCRDDHRNAIAH